MPDKIFRDPLYNYINVDKSHDYWLLQLLDAPEVQRLRRIHQLGVSNFTYPGADHNRLAHSLGVVYLMKMALDRLAQTSVAAQVGSARQALLAAALLHDVGHGPFSHLFEPCLGIKHEVWSIKIVLDPETEVYRILNRQDPYLPRRVADLIESDNQTPPSWQKALLSSQLDMDRVDYLRRDSLFTGAGYGHFDWFRLLATVDVHSGENSGDLVWPEKAAMAIEEYIFARYYMYQNVYLHKTTRGFEKLLEAMWRRAGEIRQAGGDILPVSALKDFWSSENPTTRQYINIEEFTVLSQIQAWTDHQDAAIADLARRFLSRDGFAVINPPEPADALNPDYSEWEAALHRLLKSRGFHDFDMYALADTLDGKYRRPYKPERESGEQSANNAIRIQVSGAPAPIEISDFLPRLKAVTEQPTPSLRRYYVPKEVREDAMRLSRSMLKA